LEKGRIVMLMEKSFIEFIHKNGYRTYCTNCSSLTPYVAEIIRDSRCGFRCNGYITDLYSSDTGEKLGV
jgi:hypothetical protein